MLQQLTARAKRDGLVLFVGSGISAGLVPLWKRLLGDLLQTAIKEAALQYGNLNDRPDSLVQWIQSRFDVCAKASLIKQIYS